MRNTSKTISLHEQKHYTEHRFCKLKCPANIRFMLIEIIEFNLKFNCFCVNW